MEEFGFEKLDVYQLSLDFLELAYCLIDKLPKGYATLADQLRRSTLSVPLNIAEGTGKGSSRSILFRIVQMLSRLALR